MTALERLAPDQRAVISLVLQQGRSYDEIASLLELPVDAVRARARAGLASLARDNGLPGEITGPLADYVLGQQTPADAESTRGLLAESAPARAWADDVAASLEGVAPATTAAPDVAASQEDVAPATTAAPPGPRPRPVREAPATTAAPPGPRPRPVREAPAGDDGPPASSRLGGALLIAGVLAAVAVVLYLVLSGGGDDSDAEQTAASPTPAATATPAPSAAPQVADTIALRSPSGGKAKGTMTVFLQDGQLRFALEARNVPPSGDRAAYAIWFTGPGDRARRLGFTDPVGKDGRLGIQGPSEADLADFPRLYATHERVVVSRETTDDSARPSNVVLDGKLPQGR